jgi:hypothetical protein
MKPTVYVDFPKTGLGNLLLLWARAKVFSQLNDLPLVTSSWWGIRLGAWLRNEKQKRVYWGYFVESPFGKKLLMKVAKNFLKSESNPSVAALASTKKNETKLFLFNQVSTQNDYFGEIRAHRDFVKQELHNLIHPAIYARLKNYTTPEIAIHVRRGDFKLGSPYTPNDFFIDAINFIREKTGKPFAVTVFTDAAPDEVADILALPNVALAEQKPDILDILLMSRSKFFVMSKSSTFSYWAAFLSDAILIKTADEWHNPIRPAEVNETSFEGKIDFHKAESMDTLERAIKARCEMNEPVALRKEDNGVTVK